MTMMQRVEADLLDTTKHCWQLGAAITPSLDDRAEMLIAYAHRSNAHPDALTDSDWQFICTVLVTAVCSADLLDYFAAVCDAEREWDSYSECPVEWRDWHHNGLGSIGNLDSIEERLRTNLDLSVWPLLSARPPCGGCVRSLPRQGWLPAGACTVPGHAS
jgi:hypothetical protein